MGRSFISVRMGVKEITERWLREARFVKREDEPYLRDLVSMAKRYSSEAFSVFDDPLEAVFYSVLIELLKERERRLRVDP